MQIDRSLINVEPEWEEVSEVVSYRPLRVRASVWINPMVPQSISASYRAEEQRRLPSPHTPIPARASALSTQQSMKMHARVARTYAAPQVSDVTRVPTLPEPTLLQYKSSDFAAESNLDLHSLTHSNLNEEPTIDELDTLPPSRSRMVDELDTLPPTRSRVVDELDTLPPRNQNLLIAQKSPVLLHAQHQKRTTLSFPRSISDIATIPPRSEPVVSPLMPDQQDNHNFSLRVPVQPAITESSTFKSVNAGISWTTGHGKKSLRAQRVANRTKGRKSQRKSALSLNPVDRVRWWLLYPGRIEFLLWLHGTIILFVVTCLLLFATILSSGWMHTGTSNVAVGARGVQTASTPSESTATTGKNPCSAGNATTPRCHSTIVSSSGLQLTLLNTNVLLPGTPIFLHGQGFSANSSVIFTYDAQLPCRPNATQANRQGSFTVLLTLDAHVPAGTHQVKAYDTASKRFIAVSVNIVPSSTAQSIPSTPPSSGVIPIATTGASAGQSGIPTPVSKTPVPVAPTLGVTLTAMPAQSPTAGITPSPTIETTPTISTTTTPTPVKQQKNSSSMLKDALYDEHVDGHLMLNPLLWLAAVGYVLSMTMLGLAGLLYRRSRRMVSR